MKVRRNGFKSRVRLDHRHGARHALSQQIVLPRDGSNTADLGKVTHQTSAGMASTLPEELVEEILLRVPPNEGEHMVRATVVCKAWHRILSDVTFRRRYCRFHGTPPLLGYICSHSRDATVRFVPTTSVSAAASHICAPKLDDSSGRKPSAMDCRHGRVLIEMTTEDCWGSRQKRLVVWDTISGSQQHLSLPTYPQHRCWYSYAGAVLCAKHGCDHFDCHGGPFLVVLLRMSYDYYCGDLQTRASVYSSETGAWSSLTTPSDMTNQHVDGRTPGLLVGDALYFTTFSWGYTFVKYDLCKHELSVMDPPALCMSILIKANDGGLGVAAMLRDGIYMWSWQVDNNKGVGGWVEDRVMELDDTWLLKGDLICMAEGTNTVFIGVESTGVFTLDLRSRQVRKIGKKETFYYRPILPYMSFSTPKY